MHTHKHSPLMRVNCNSSSLLISDTHRSLASLEADCMDTRQLVYVMQLNVIRGGGGGGGGGMSNLQKVVPGTWNLTILFCPWTVMSNCKGWWSSSGLRPIPAICAHPYMEREKKHITYMSHRAGGTVGLSPTHHWEPSNRPAHKKNRAFLL